MDTLLNKSELQRLFLRFKEAKDALHAALPGVPGNVLGALAVMFEQTPTASPTKQTRATGPGKQKCGICGKRGHNMLGHKTAAKTASTKGRQVSREAQARATKGRQDVLSGKRPPIKEVITKVLGNHVMNAQRVYEAIKAKGQLPNSRDPKSYIGYLLSASKITDPKTGLPIVDSEGKEYTLWERVPERGRGFYRNRPKNWKAAQTSHVSKPKAAKSSVTKAVGNTMGLKKAILSLLGRKGRQNVQQIYDTLRAQGFMFASKDPKKSIDDCVSKHKADFVRVSQGVWRLVTTDDVLKKAGVDLSPATNGVQPP